MDQNALYFDYAAATPLDRGVLAAMQPYFTDFFYNPSATYLAAHKVHDALEQARAAIARAIGSRQTEIVFTAGGTEANNLAIQGVMRRYPDGKVLVSAIEHDSVLEPARLYDHEELAVQTDGRIDMEALRSRIDDRTVLVSIMYANNEIGTIQPLREIGRLLEGIRKERRKAGNTRPLYFHTDACQAANYLDMHVDRLGVDLMTINGGKIYGPKQSGALYVKAGTILDPLIVGGGQERNLRSGTEHTAACVGLAAAFEKAQALRAEEVSRLQELQRQFIRELGEKLPQVLVTGSLKYRLPNNVHVTISGQDNERLIFALDEAGVMAAAGSACSASDEESSHVLKAIGMTDLEANASLRFTMGRGTTPEAVTVAVEKLAGLVE